MSTEPPTITLQLSRNEAKAILREIENKVMNAATICKVYKKIDSPSMDVHIINIAHEANRLGQIGLKIRKELQQ